MTVTVALTDAGKDGWNGNVLAIKQGNNIQEFGRDFTSGGQGNSVQITLQGYSATQIIVTQLGTKTEEIGFKVTASNGTVIYEKADQAPIYQGTIFSSFCPRGGCYDDNYLALAITMSDYDGDGWHGNILAIKQNNTIVGTFGLSEGLASGPTKIIVQRDLGVQVAVFQLGSYTNEIGFFIKTSIEGGFTFRRAPGAAIFFENKIFATFCPTERCFDLYKLAITMIDSGGDGWNGNILAIRQNGSIVAAFGSNFIAGASSGPVYATILGNQET